MRDITSETLVPLRDVADRYPARGGRRKHIGVVRRWVRKGVAGVKLEAVQLAGRWHTSEEALARFHAGVAAARQRSTPPAPRHPRGSARTADDAAARKLRRMGLPA